MENGKLQFDFQGFARDHTSCFLCSASRSTSSLKGALFGTPISFFGFRLIPFFFASFRNYGYAPVPYNGEKEVCNNSQN